MTVLLCILGFFGGLAASERDSLLEDTQGNRDVWTSAFEVLDGEELRCAEHLFGSIPRLDRLEMTTEVLNDHISGALETARECFPALPDSIFLTCLLEYRVDQEPVSAYRTSLREHWSRKFPDASGDPHGTALQIANSISDEVDIHEQGYLGGVEPPLIVLSAGTATPVECTVLLCASLRSVGIAARQITGWFGGEQGGMRRWVEVYSPDNGWMPVTLPWETVPAGFEGLALAVWETTGGFVTKSAVETGMAVIVPPAEPPAGEWTGTVCVPVRNGFLPLDWVWFDPTVPDTVELGAGDYLFCASTRTPDGQLEVHARLTSIAPGGEHIVQMLP